MMRKILNKINLLLIVFTCLSFAPSTILGDNADDKNQILENYKRSWQTSSKERKKETGKIYVEQIITVADGCSIRGDMPEAIRLYAKALYMIPNYAMYRGYEVSRKLKNARNSQKLQNQIEQYSRLLNKNPDNIIIRRKLILTYIIEFDCPASAKKLLTIYMSEELRTYVPQADLDTNEIAKEVCLELGDWYRSLTSKATLKGRGNVLARARSYYDRFLKLETDAARCISSEAKLDKVDKELQKLGIPGGKYFTLAIGKDVTMKLVLIPAGNFIMGSPNDEADRESNEGPQYKVTIRNPFYMGIYEVTQEQYKDVVGMSPNKFKGQSQPVGMVRWNDAMEFCKRLSAKIGRIVRLPTEAEWEYACRAGSKTMYSFGNAPDKLSEHSWFHGNARMTIHPVGQKTPNSWGLYDMHGNVWEWCGDWYGEKYDAPTKDHVNPTGPLSGHVRVLRGGSFNDFGKYCRSAYRLGYKPDSRVTQFGFRVILLKETQCNRKH